MVSGRLREHDREDIAIKMLDWCKEESSLNLCGFCAKYELDPDVVLRWSKQDEFFGRTYRIVKSTLGERRERKLKEGELHNKAYDLNAATYDLFLKDERQTEKKFESELASQIAQQGTEIQNEKFDKLCDEFRRSQLSAANSASSNINKDSQS